MKKNPFQILDEYEKIKRNPGELVQEITISFNMIYNSIPANMKPPHDLALLHYPDGFDDELAYEIR